MNEQSEAKIADSEDRSVDVSEFVRDSEGVDPAALALQFERDLERSINDHRMTREQLETPLTV